MGSGGDANEDLYEMLGWGDRAVVIIYCETDSSVAIPSFCVSASASASQAKVKPLLTSSHTDADAE